MERSWWYRLTVILLFYCINSNAQVLPAVLDLDTYGVTTRRLDLPAASTPTTPNYAKYSAQVTNTQDFTTECYFRVTDISTPHTTVGQWIINERGPNSPNWNYQLNYSKVNSRVNFTIRNNNNTVSFSAFNTTPLSSNTWYHVAGVCDCTSIPDTCQLTVYIDGISGGTLQFYEPIGRFIDPLSTLTIGIGDFARTQTLTALYGQIDEVRIWNYARTSEQINKYMKKRLRCPESGLVAYYSLNEGSGTTGGDCAGTAQNVTLVNNAVFITN